MTNLILCSSPDLTGEPPCMPPGASFHQYHYNVKLTCLDQHILREFHVENQESSLHVRRDESQTPSAPLECGCELNDECV